MKKPSRFLAELGVGAARRAREPPARLRRAQGVAARARAADDVPAYVVFHNATLEEIAARPRSLDELAAVPGVGPAKLERYGEGVLAALAEA